MGKTKDIDAKAVKAGFAELKKAWSGLKAGHKAARQSGSMGPGVRATKVFVDQRKALMALMDQAARRGCAAVSFPAILAC